MVVRADIWFIDYKKEPKVGVLPSCLLQTESIPNFGQTSFEMGASEMGGGTVRMDLDCVIIPVCCMCTGYVPLG